MVANYVYWRRDSRASKRTFATIKSTIYAVKFSNTIGLRYLHSNVIMYIGLDVYCHIIDKMT